MDCDTTHLTTSNEIFSYFNLLLTPSNTGTQQVKDGFPIWSPQWLVILSSLTFINVKMSSNKLFGMKKQKISPKTTEIP